MENIVTENTNTVDSTAIEQAPQAQEASSNPMDSVDLEHLENASSDELTNILDFLTKQENTDDSLDDLETQKESKQQVEENSANKDSQEKTPQENQQSLTAEQYQALLQQMALLQQQNTQKETEIQKRRGRISQLVEENKQLKAKLEEGLDELTLTDPLERRRREKELDKVEENIKDLESEGQAMTFEENTKAFFFKHQPTYIQYTLDDMAEVLRQDGIPEQYITQFKASPFRYTQPDTLVQVAHRAAERKVAKQLYELNLQLKAQIEKTSKGSTGNVLKNIRTAAKTIPSMTASRQGAAASGEDEGLGLDLSEQDITNLSDSELKELQSKIKKRKL